jgi:hypothetical protein
MATYIFRLVTVLAIATMTIAITAPATEAKRSRDSRAPAPMLIGPGPGLGVGMATGGVRVGGQVTGGGGSSVLESVARGAVVGTAGGPIGVAIGAGAGLLHGLWVKHRQEAQARAEAERQRQIDRELEEQMAAQQPVGAMTGATDEQGVLIVKNHLDEPASASPGRDAGTHVASVPPDPAYDAPPGDRPDAEGFRSVHEGDRLVRRERRAVDGRIEVVLHYDAQGRMVRREESTRLDGRLDTSIVYADGKPVAKESDTDGDGHADVWAMYDAAGELSRLESLVEGGRRHTQRYAGGAVTQEEWRRDADGALLSRVAYENGRVREKLDGGLLSVFDEAGRLSKEGRVGIEERMVAWRHFDANGDVAREEEFGEDGRLTVVTHYERGRLVRKELYEIDETAFTRVPLASPDAGGAR